LCADGPPAFRPVPAPTPASPAEETKATGCADADADTQFADTQFADADIADDICERYGYHGHSNEDGMNTMDAAAAADTATATATANDIATDTQAVNGTTTTNTTSFKQETHDRRQALSRMVPDAAVLSARRLTVQVKVQQYGTEKIMRGKPPFQEVSSIQTVIKHAAAV
jgi:hypothetical protein